MKIWRSYGSEHSMNLVMIGRFKDAADAAQAKDLIDQLTSHVLDDDQTDRDAERFSDSMLDLLMKLKVHSVGPAELDQFRSDVSVTLKDNQVELRTDEVDVSAFLKVLLDNGARVEVFSAHNHPETGDGHGK
jgi:uncharacterized protein DUF6375